MPDEIGKLRRKIRGLKSDLVVARETNPPDGETDPEAICARWATKHAEVAREQEVARFSMPLTAMLD